MNLKELLCETFRPAHIDIQEEEDDEGKEFVATLTGLNGLEWDDFDSIEELDEYVVEAWIFGCEDGGKLVLHIREVKA